MDSKRRTVLTTGAAAMAMAAAPGAFAQGSGKGETAMRFPWPINEKDTE